MGGEESKFCASKNNSSKKCITKLLKLGLREEEANHMYKLLGEQRFVPRSHIEKLWHNLLTPTMMEIYDHYLVFHTDPKCGEDSIDVFAFSLFVSNFIKGTSEDRVNMYSTFLKKTEDDVIEISNLQQYVIQLMKSVISLMAAKKVEQHEQWLNRGHTFDDNDLERWASATILNAYNSNDTEIISSDQLMPWLTLNTDVILLQCYLFHSLYELDKLEHNKHGEHKTIHSPLPFLEVNVQKDDWQVIINIPAATFINSHLPTENRYKWRLVYSTDINGESFTTFRSLICNTGPTILVIKDKDNHIFGGYASTDWHVGPKFFGDERCFLFSLQPVMKIYPTLPHNDHFQYLNFNQKSLPNGLGMGGQLGYWGLWIDASFEFGVCSPSCSTYAGYQMLSGSPEFRIAGLEVWAAEGPFNPDENNSTVNSVGDYLKKDKEAASILHKDPAARAIMDMLGKTGSGRDFLDANG